MGATIPTETTPIPSATVSTKNEPSSTTPHEEKAAEVVVDNHLTAIQSATKFPDAITGLVKDFLPELKVEWHILTNCYDGDDCTGNDYDIYSGIAHTYSVVGTTLALKGKFKKIEERYSATGKKCTETPLGEFELKVDGNKIMYLARKIDTDGEWVDNTYSHTYAARYTSRKKNGSFTNQFGKLPGEDKSVNASEKGVLTLQAIGSGEGESILASLMKKWDRACPNMNGKSPTSKYTVFLDGKVKSKRQS